MGSGIDRTLPWIAALGKCAVWPPELPLDGQPTRSFNLGFDGMRPPEDSYVLETVLAHRTKPLKYGDKLREMRPGALKKLRKGVADRLQKPAQPYFSDAESQRVLREKGRVIAGHGGKMVLFHPPLTQAEIYYPDPRFNPALPLIDLSGPGKFPILFDPQFRKDDAHLNPAGAKIFTRLLVERLLAPSLR
jgi:hypothetical protein